MRKIAEHHENTPQKGLFPLSPELLRRLFAEQRMRQSSHEASDTPEFDDV